MVWRIMTIKELIKELKQYPNKDMPVFMYTREHGTDDIRTETNSIVCKDGSSLECVLIRKKYYGE